MNKVLWSRTFILSERNLLGSTFVLRDTYMNTQLSLDLKQQRGTLPPADKCLFYCAGIPLGMKTHWKVIPETERSMAKLHIEQDEER